MKVVIAGGSGFIGQALVKEFEAGGYQSVVLSRSGGRGSVQWDGKSLGPWTQELEGASAVINLSGESVAQKWTSESKRRILDSRVESTSVIGEAIRAAKNPPEAWVNASAVGYYGSTGDEVKVEDSPAGSDLLAQVCCEWEHAMFSSPAEARRVAMRIGFPLGRGGGAFPLLWRVTKLFAGGAVGSGRQYIPWLHVEDLARMFRFAVENEIEGPVNAVGPEPVPMNAFMKEMRRIAGRPWAPNAPAFVLKIGEVFGGPPAHLPLYSSRVLPKVLQSSGFSYRFPSLSGTIEDLARRDA